MMLNLGCCTASRAWSRTATWAKGDALYYALNMDHFYRFYPQELSSILGLNMFRPAMWITHWFEALFPLMVLGTIIRWGIREQLPSNT